MNRSLAITALATMIPCASHANGPEPYVGISVATPGEARLATGPSSSVANDKGPTAFKLYGGVSFNPAWSLELGYGAFGSWHFTDPAPGTHDEASISSRAVTVAARYTLDLGSSFAAFGKLGLAANRFSYRDNVGQSASDSFVRPLWGFGLEAKLSERLSMPLEFEYLGAAKTKFGEFRQQKLELGLRYRF